MALIHLVFIALMAWFAYQAWKSHKSGTIVGGSFENPEVRKIADRHPIYKTNGFYLGAATLVFYIIFIVWSILEK